MAEYIEREAAIEAVEAQCVDGKMYGRDDGEGTLVDAYDIIDAISDAPAADVVEVRHGRWDEVYGSDTIRCSCCRKRLDAYYADGVPFFDPDYCPNCGTRMDGGNGNETD